MNRLPLRLYVRRNPGATTWLWDVYEDGDRCYVSAGTCGTWAEAMAKGALAWHAELRNEVENYMGWS